MGNRRLLFSAIAALALLVSLVATGCTETGGGVEQRIKVTVETMSQGGTLLMMEYYKGDEQINSMRLIDGDGDGIIDGKSGPTKQGNWPQGWGWFDDLYEEVIVGQSRMDESGGKVTISDEVMTHELRAGEYHAGQAQPEE